MRGHDEQTTHMFSYLSPEQRVPADHPLRAVRALTDEALQTMSRRFASLYATTGRPSIPPEQLLRALLLQVLYTVRSERLLMEELNDNLLFRWFVVYCPRVLGQWFDGIRFYAAASSPRRSRRTWAGLR